MSTRVGVAVPAPGSTETFAAWALDLPGCFATGSDEVAAIGALSAAIDRYLTIAVAASAEAPPRPTGGIEVVERFHGSWQGTYEVDAFFAVDAAPVTEIDVTFAQAMLAATRRRLLAAADPAPRRRAGERTVGEVLHHVANAEWFYGSRLEMDPEVVRSDGLGDEIDPRKRLELVRAWALRRIATFPGLGGLERTHHGERWTPRKVIRRYIYHELDHLWELESVGAIRS
jgi:hypothetical protein